MQDEKDCTAFNTFGSDLKEARNALGLSRRALAEKVGMDPRYLANIENSGFIPSLSLFHDLATSCKLPVEKYFYPELDGKESEQRTGSSSNWPYALKSICHSLKVLWTTQFKWKKKRKTAKADRFFLYTHQSCRKNNYGGFDIFVAKTRLS